MPNDIGPNWDWPVDFNFAMHKQLGRLTVSGLIGPIHKFVLMPAYQLDDKGVFRVISWSFVPRENVLKPEFLAKLEQQERDIENA